MTALFVIGIGILIFSQTVVGDAVKRLQSYVTGEEPAKAGAQGSAFAPKSSPKSSGRWSWPVSGRGKVISVFGDCRPVGSDPCGRSHEGVDIGAPDGRGVRASRGGNVTFAADNGNYGNVVYVDHGDGFESRYAHLSRIIAKVGQRIAQGAPVGKVGTTGNATGGTPHLHFEIRSGGTAVDPLGYIK